MTKTKLLSNLQILMIIALIRNDMATYRLLTLEAKYI